MTRLRNLDRFQKAVLLILAAMAILFGILYVRASFRIGYAFRDTLFLPSYENGKTNYTATLYDTDCSFTVTDDNVVSFLAGDRFYGPYTAVEDPTAIPPEYAGSANAVGVELRNNGTPMFRGAVLTNSSSGFHLIDANGDLFGLDIIVTMSDGTQIDGNGTIVDPWKPSVHNILELMGNPPLTKKGAWPVFFLGVFLSVITAVSVLFPEELFRLGLVFRVRDWGRVEPSDLEVAGRYISWTILPVVIFVCYLMGLNL